MSSLTPSTYKSSPSSLLKWTPPLSPTQKSLRRSKVCDDENEQSAAMCVAMLRRPGLPPLQAITNLKGMVGAAPRAWILDFKIRGGRSVFPRKLIRQRKVCLACSSSFCVLFFSPSHVFRSRFGVCSSGVAGGLSCRQITLHLAKSFPAALQL